MRTIVGARASGKTFRMLQWMRKAPSGETRILVSHTMAAAEYAMNRARDLGYMKPEPHICPGHKVCKNEDTGLERWQFTSVGSLDNLRGHSKPLVLGFDEVALCLSAFTRHQIGAMSVDASDMELASPVLNYYET